MLRLALYYHRAGDFDRAQAHYRALLDRDELDPQAHNNLGLLFRDRGMLDQAVREFRRALIIDEHDCVLLVLWRASRTGVSERTVRK